MLICVGLGWGGLYCIKVVLIADVMRARNSRPPNPLHVLGEYLIQKSNEVEGGGGAAASDKKSPE